VKQRRVFREWQHPRDGKGRFSRSGGGSWAKRAAAGFAVVEEMPMPDEYGDPEDWR
jgi:hypothetical protein